VADSPAELAVQMRALIRKKLEAGESEQQIIASFVEAYGDSVLLQPPRRGLGWLFWLAPVAVLLAGSLALTVLLRGWARRGAKGEMGVSPVDRLTDPLPSSAADDPSAERARRELEAVRRGLAP
jgi:cytochrome c-type biogenesis protein CcmH